MARLPPSTATRKGAERKVCVLYVAGWGRSGSTLLEQLLASLPGFAATGELRRLWSSGLRRDHRCGCGVAFSACPFWAAVLDRVPWMCDPARRRNLEREARRLDRSRRIPGLLAAARLDSAAEEFGYADTLGRLYRAVRNVAGAEVVIDSSKSPAYGFVLAAHPEIDLRVVHLVRDSRAVAYSMLRRRRDPSAPQGPVPMATASTTKSALEWSSRNLLAAALALSPARYTRMRYEQLAVDPPAALRRALSQLGLDVPASAIAGLSEVSLGETHTVAGNPLRFHRGRLPVQLDDEWRQAMSPADRRWVTALTWPFRW